MATLAMLRASWRSWFSQDFRIVGPAWLQYVWTFVFCAMVAAGFTLLSFAVNAAGRRNWVGLAQIAEWYRINLVISLCVGYAIHLLMEGAARAIGLERLRRFGRAQRIAFFTGLPVLGVLIGWPLGVRLGLGADLLGWFSLERPAALVGAAGLALLSCLVFYAFFVTKHRQIEAEDLAAEARLKLLQGQIEPHFLFNTLANVIGLMERDTPRAKLMLESFVDYLRASLGSLRHDRHTVGDELALVEAYLQVIGMRMHDRLSWQVDVDEALRPLALPALTLQPLVENAIVHGLEPKVEGGRLSLRGRAEGGRLVFEVDDDGLGLAAAPTAATSGSGSALANTRARLLHRYGTAAGLQVAARPGGGVSARLFLPADMAQRS
jgi:signal transduction histidine kinase